jgi:ubiquinone/menaquinone biosynthesis C-methylase UbiE
MASSRSDESLLGYDKVAKDYDKRRPDYPQEIITLLTQVLDLKPGISVVDLAAGTGKVTKALLPLKLNLYAVEPVAEMREVFTQHFPNVPILDGKAEAIPLLLKALMWSSSEPLSIGFKEKKRFLKLHAS